MCRPRPIQMSPNTTVSRANAANRWKAFPSVRGSYAEQVNLECGKPKPTKHEKDPDELTEKYLKDQSFRGTIGPGMEVYADWGYPDALFDLQIDLDFGHFGKVRGIAKKGENVKGDGLEIEWRIGADYDKQNSFTSTISTRMEGK